MLGFYIITAVDTTCGGCKDYRLLFKDRADAKSFMEKNGFRVLRIVKEN